MDAAKKRGLDPALRRLGDLIEDMEFGRITSLRVSDGLPVFDPPPKIYYDVKLKPTPSAKRKANGELPDEIINLTLQLRLVEDGIVESIEVKHGLPFRIIVERVYESR